MGVSYDSIAKSTIDRVNNAKELSQRSVNLLKRHANPSSFYVVPADAFDSPNEWFIKNESAV